MSGPDETATIGIEDLPHIDEHAIAVHVDDPALVWSALGDHRAESPAGGDRL